MKDEKIIFHSITRKKKTKPTPAGKETLTEWIEEINEDGKKELKENGQTNIYDRIQAAHAATQIYNILERYEQTQDPGLLQKKMGEYTDVTNAPKNLAEAHRRIQAIEKTFETLPLEMRKEFNHDAGQFIKRVGNGDVQAYEIIRKFTNNDAKSPDQSDNQTPREAAKKGDKEE